MTSVTEDEAMMQAAAARFAADEVMPRVASMDDASKMEPELIRAIFDAGFMGVEIDERCTRGRNFDHSRAVRAADVCS